MEQIKEIIRTELYRTNEEYEKFRIPGMIVTKSGTLLLVCEARRSTSDWSRMDILLRRSTDGGKNFSAPTALVEGTEQHPTVNNPVMIEDKNGRIHLLYCEDYAIKGGRVLQKTSDDNGVTWSEARDITSSTEPDVRNVFAFGPGHGICTKSGTLIVPFWRVPKRYRAALHSHMPSEIGTIYSLDNGETWHIGAILTTKDGILTPNETEIAELCDGRIYLNTRLGAGLTYRARAYSADGYSSWTGFEPDFELCDPICFGSCSSYVTKSGESVLLFANCNHPSERKNVTLKISFDNGKTWKEKHVIDKDRGGYTELAVDNAQNRIYVLYEEDWGSAQHLVTMSL